LSFDAEKSRFGEAIELCDVSSSCRGERGDFERVLRQESINDDNECVRDKNRCDEHSSNNAYESITHIVELCARERASETIIMLQEKKKKRKTKTREKELIDQMIQREKYQQRVLI